MGVTLPGARVLITGASSGIGACLAEALAGHCTRLLLCGTDRDRLAEVATRTGGTALIADLTVPTELDQVRAEAADVDLLVHSAGRGWAGPTADMPADLIRSMTELNLTAPISLTQAALPGMRARGRGHLVFLASIAVVGVREEACYAASKAGLRAFAASVREEVSQHGIGVTTVLPAAVATSFFARRGRAYHRRVPRPVPAPLVARRTLRAVHRNQAELFLPRWMTIPARINGAAPTTFHRLAARCG